MSLAAEARSEPVDDDEDGVPVPPPGTGTDGYGEASRPGLLPLGDSTPVSHDGAPAAASASNTPVRLSSGGRARVASRPPRGGVVRRSFEPP